MRLLSSLLALGATLAVACGGSPSSGDGGVDPCSGYPAAAFETVTTDSGAYRIAVRTAPSQPPPRGIDTVQYVITNAAGAPQDGLSVQVVPWMTAMNHGTSLTPTVAPCGNGAYGIGDVAFSMPGDWELQTTISGTVTDHANPTFQIP